MKLAAKMEMRSLVLVRSSKANVSSISPLLGRIEELWVVCGLQLFRKRLSETIVKMYASLER